MKTIDYFPIRPTADSTGRGANTRCYVCGEPATYGREMNTPSGGSYVRGWCAAHGPQSDPEARRHAPPTPGNRAVVVEFAEPALGSRDLWAGKPVTVEIRGTVLRAWPDRIEVLVGGEGRMVAVVPRALLET